MLKQDVSFIFFYIFGFGINDIVIDYFKLDNNLKLFIYYLFIFCLGITLYLL